MCVCVWYTIAPLLLLKMSFRNLCFQFKKILVTLKLEVNCKRITNFCSPCIRYSQFFKMVFIVVLFFAYITLIFILNLTSFFSSEKFKVQFCFQRRWWYFRIYFFKACIRIHCYCYTFLKNERFFSFFPHLFKKIFYWSIIPLQYCVSFSCTA